MTSPCSASSWTVWSAPALARDRDPEGVKRFVQAARYPIHKQATDTWASASATGAATCAAWVWGLSVPEYLQKADVLTLNPEGEIILGVKLEDQ